MSKKRIVIGIVLLAALIFLRFSGVGKFLTLAHLQEQRETLLYFVAHHFIGSVLVYIMVYTGIVAANLPAAALMTLVGGFLFGTWGGLIFSNIGATCGAVLSFLWVRHLLGTGLQIRYQKRLASFNKNIEENGVFYLLFVHFLGVPFFLVNTLAALTTVSLWTFTWTTSVGIIPVSLLLAFMGQRLGEIDSVGELFTPSVWLALLALALLSLVPLLLKLKRQRSV